MESADGDAGAPSVTRVEFGFTDPAYPFVEIAVRESCVVHLEEIVPRGDDRYAEFFSVRGADPDRVLAVVEDAPEIEARPLSRDDDGGLFEFLVSSDACPAVHLAEHGALPRGVRGVEGGARIVAEVPPSEDAGAVVDAFVDAHPEAELVARRDQSGPTAIFGEWDLRQVLDRRLTARQREVMSAAHDAGYYDWPREATAEEVAAELDIAGATFHKHLRAAERKLVATLFEGPLDD